MTPIPFTKAQGAGNDFLILESTPQPALFPPQEIQRLCDRRFGVGADGIVFLSIPGANPGADADLRLFNSDGSEAESCTIVTTAAADSIARIHERMPVILDRADFPAWLSGTPEEAQTLLQPCRGALRSYTVSSRVNSVRNDDASLLEPAAAPPAEKRQLDLL